MKVLFGGDVWLAPSLSNNREALSGVGKNFSSYDLFVCNLEAPSFTDTPRAGRRALLYTDTELLGFLNIAKQNVLLLGNNHINDYGDDGIRQIIKVSKENDFHVVGAGLDIVEACTPLVLDIEGRRIAIMSYADTNPWVGAIAASDESPGVAPLDVDLIVETIKANRALADDIWVFLHWGHEFVRAPHPAQKGIAYDLIDAGASLIVGHHQHVALGYEKVDHSPIFYGLGNFIFPHIPLQDGDVLKWGDKERFSICVTGQLDGCGWSFSAKTLFLNNQGLPEFMNTKKAEIKMLFVNYYTKLSSSIYIYNVIYIYEKLIYKLKKITKPNKILKSIIWRLKNNF